MERDDVAGYLDSWVIHLSAERKSPNTIRAYTAGVAAWMRWCERNGLEPLLERDQVPDSLANYLLNYPS